MNKDRVDKKTHHLKPEVLIPRLGDHLVERGDISKEALNKALEYQQKIKKQNGTTPLLGQILVEMELLDQASLDQAITEIILQLRNALQKYNQQLERRVQERTSELEEALNRLSELNKLKSNFVANISHELRTPLTHIVGYLELFVNDDLGPLSGEQKQAMTVMQRSANRLGNLIEDLILFSMTESGQVNIILQPFNIVQTCQDVIIQKESLAKQHNVNLEIQAEYENIYVEGDQEKIAWAIKQIIDNGIKFTPSNGKVTVEITPESDYTIIQIIDNGIGIPRERLEEIFEPFHQLDGSSTRKFGGTGLGLTLVRKIIEAHNSFITVRSDSGFGSTFSFRLKTA